MTETLIGLDASLRMVKAIVDTALDLYPEAVAAPDDGGVAAAGVAEISALRGVVRGLGAIALSWPPLCGTAGFGNHCGNHYFLRRTLRVDRQLVTISGHEPRFGPPKSDSSVRTVPLADGVLEALSAHLAAFPPGPDGLVCTLDDGRPIRRNAFGHMWRRGPQKVAPFRYHDLRHHFASVLIAAGCSVKAVQQALGHSSAKQTLDTYAHLWPESDDLTRAAIQAALGHAVSSACHEGVSA